jgi:hypothetical protein
MAQRLRRTGWLLVGAAGLLALTVIFVGAALAAACAGVLCLLGSATLGWLSRRATETAPEPLPAEGS